MESYQAYKRKDRVARILMLSSMRNDLMLHFEKHRSALAVLDAVKVQYGGTSTTRLRQLTLNFDDYKKKSNHTMRQHLTIMSNMISELRGDSHELTDKQQVQAVIRSLPSAWEHLCINLTNNDNIKTFDDVARHVKLEEDRLLGDKPYGEAYMTESMKIGASDSGQNKWKGKVRKQMKEGNKSNFSKNKRKRRRHSSNKSKNMN